MRNSHPIVCHYCHTEVTEGKADIWKWNGRWFGCCDSCKESNPKQQEAKKRKDAKQNAKSAKKAQENAKNGKGRTNLAQELQKLSKDDLIKLIASLK